MTTSVGTRIAVTTCASQIAAELPHVATRSELQVLCEIISMNLDCIYARLLVLGVAVACALMLYISQRTRRNINYRERLSRRVVI